MPVGVEDPDLAAGTRVSDRHVDTEVVVGRPLVDHAADDGFGRSVLVEDAHARRAHVEHTLRHRAPERLAADDDRAQRSGGGREPDEEFELRRRGLQERDPVVGGDLAERGDRLLVEHHDPATGEMSEEQARDREVEHQRGVQRDDGRLVVGVGVDGEREIVGEPTMRDRHTLGRAGRTGGVEDVGAVIEVDVREHRRVVADRVVGDRVVAGRVVRCLVDHLGGERIQDREEVGVGGDQVVADGSGRPAPASRTRHPPATRRGSPRGHRCRGASAARPRAPG
jgi:hypothetical protein